MNTEEREEIAAESILRFFEEKSPLDYDILDSMFQRINPIKPDSK